MIFFWDVFFEFNSLWFYFVEWWFCEKCLEINERGYGGIKYFEKLVINKWCFLISKNFVLILLLINFWI